MSAASVDLNTLSARIAAHDTWCRTQGVALFGDKVRDWDKLDYVVQQPARTEGLALLEKTFGPLPASYRTLIAALGHPAFIAGYYGLLRVLTPGEVITLYESVQAEMDFHEENRAYVQDEYGIDFSRLIPVMAGKGVDGCWGLLDMDSAEGRVFYWDADQVADMGSVYPDLAAFIDELLTRAQSDDVMRLT